ncbi:DUF1800 domain-containing protein [Vibrio sp. WXL210]|uniref:DUF1800 domain-containing protein n=1 Tax=Vibrio sp. WXL210 TaxID=3450709 RepID=UPI003EC94FE4
MSMTHKDASRFLERATFGPRKEEIDTIKDIGINSWLDGQFSHEPSLHYERYRFIQEYRASVNGSKQEHWNYRINAWWDIALKSEDQLRQRVAFALSQLVVVSQRDPGLADKNQAAGLAKYYDILVRNAFGSYADLLKEVSRSSPMGVFLTIDGNIPPSETSIPDQNYARELMQLFTLGDWQVDIEGNFIRDENGGLITSHSQEDIEALARVFTGWKVKDSTLINDMVVDENDHDQNEKLWLGHTLAAGVTAEEEMEFVVERLIEQTETAVLVSKHLIKHLVTSNPSRAYVGRVASVFQNSLGDLEQVVEAILTDSECLSEEVTTRKAKEPIIAFSSLCRALNAKMGANYPHHRDTGIGFGYLDQYSPNRPTKQGALMAPTVFNFYDPDYAPLGAINDQGLIAPEFEIMSGNDLTQYGNLLNDKIKNAVRDGDTASKSDKYLYLDITPFIDLYEPEQADLFLAEINDTFYNGSMRSETYDYVNEAMSSYGFNRDNCWKIIWLVAMSPEFNVQG